MLEFAGEKETVRDVVAAGRRFGFGNMIERLKFGWLRLLLEDPKISVYSAALGARFSKDEAKHLDSMDRGQVEALICAWLEEPLPTKR